MGCALKFKNSKFIFPVDAKPDLKCLIVSGFDGACRALGNATIFFKIICISLRRFKYKSQLKVELSLSMMQLFLAGKFSTGLFMPVATKF